MKIVIFSSVFNHHSLPLCDALNAIENVQCIFVETMEEEQQRRDLGYHAYDRDYVLNMLESEENRAKAYELALSADVMIASVFPYEFLKERLERNKLTFLCQERMFKGKVTLQRKLRAWAYNMRKFHCFRKKPLYFLSIGDMAAEDYRSIGFYKGKSFRWAYYPPFLSYDLGELAKKKESESIQLLFVGRLIPLKHPEFILTATKALLQKGYPVRLTYIGNGPMEGQLREAAEPIQNSVRFLGSMSPEDVRKHMEESQIVAFTSDAMEGWGAVVNEAMNAGCAIVASDAPGAVKTMMKDGENGFVYKADDYEQFYEKLERLVNDRALVRTLGAEAYKTVSEHYNAREAAKRFYRHCDSILNGKQIPMYIDGPMKKLP